MRSEDERMRLATTLVIGAHEKMRVARRKLAGTALARPRGAVLALLALVALICAACDDAPAAGAGAESVCGGAPRSCATVTATPARHTSSATAPACSSNALAAAGAAVGASCPGLRFVGGFSIQSVDAATAAAQAGVQVAFTYGGAWTTATQLGATFHRLGIEQVVGTPEVYLQEFECHRVLTLHLKSFPLGCPHDFPAMATESAMLAAVRRAVATDGHDPSVLGYWVLDDWPYTDTAEAAALLPQIAGIVHTLAPGKQTICGFGASMTPIGTPWDDYNPAVLGSYTPQGCDLPAFYIYSEPVSNPNTPPSTFDWTMRRLLADMLTDLTARGWSRADGFIGIGQAWAGTLPGSSRPYEVEPTPGEMAAQAAAFCQSGAVGAVYYAWAAGGIQQLHTPANDPQMLSGVRQGAQACQQIWSAGS